MTLTLKPANIDEAEFWLAMQVECFRAHQEKYGDSNFWPAASTAVGLGHLRERFAEPWREHLWIVADDETVGGIRVTRYMNEPGRYKLTTIMILPQHQNCGIGQKAMWLLESRYPDAKTWELGTVLQEKRNLHFYEKLGYRRIGEPRDVNGRFGLVEYRREIQMPNSAP